jgi:spore coat protein U-like protein
MKKILLTMVVLTAGVVFSANSYAATTSTTLGVSLTAVVLCTVQTSPVVFDGYDGTLDVFANGDVTVDCPDGLPYAIALDAGQNFDGLIRNMNDDLENGQSIVSYYLYQPDGVTYWGDAGGYGDTYLDGGAVFDVGNNLPQPHQVQGHVPESQNVPLELAYDGVTVTVYY